MEFSELIFRTGKVKENRYNKMDIKVISKNGVLIRLPEERWIHIVENHDDLAGNMDDVLDIQLNREVILWKSNS